MDKKKLHTWEFQLKHSSRNMRRKLLQKRFIGKRTECSKHLRDIAIEKNILSELNRCTFQIPISYSKNTLLYWYYTVLIFTSKLCDPPPHPPRPKLEGGGGACPESSIKTKSLNTKPCPVGLSPRMMCQASPLLPKMSQNCCTHQV